MIKYNKYLFPYMVPVVACALSREAERIPWSHEQTAVTSIIPEHL